MNAPNTGIVNIRGKEYHTVAKRVHVFRDAFPEHSLTTDIIARDQDCVVMRAAISDEAGRTIATGFAEENRKGSQINRTSALENCETSAIGRALAAFGIGGTEYASANEVENAIHQQQEGRSQGDSQGEVSPPAKPKNWGGRYPTKTALKKAMHEHHAEIERIGLEGAMDDLETYLASPEYQDFIKQASENAPHYLEGPRHKQAPPEFIQTFALESKSRDMIAIRGNQPIEKENT